MEGVRDRLATGEVPRPTFHAKECRALSHDARRHRTASGK